MNFLQRSPQTGELLLFLAWGEFLASSLGSHMPAGSRPMGAQIVTAAQAAASGFKGVILVNKLTGEAKAVRLSEYTFLTGIDCLPRAGLILAVTLDSGKAQIRIFRPDGSGERKLIEESDRISSARWSPAGDAIYFLHGKGSTTDLSKIYIDSRHIEPVPIANGLQTGEFFTLSTDGSRLAYTREDKYSNLWQLRFQTVTKAKPEISRLTSGTSYYGAPSFSPDGHWISFALGPFSFGLGPKNIFKMPATGGEPVQLTYFEHAMTASPVWSPDGQRIAFVSDENGTPRVWVMSANGGTPQALKKTNASNTNNRLAWWPSSDLVYQKPGDRNYLRVNQKTQTETTIIQHNESEGSVPLSQHSHSTARKWQSGGIGEIKGFGSFHLSRIAKHSC